MPHVSYGEEHWPVGTGEEAAACGCWVVASDLGGIGEDVDESNCFVVKPRTREIARVLDVIARNPSRFKGAAGAPALRTVDDQVAELAQCYQELAVSPRRTSEPS